MLTAASSGVGDAEQDRLWKLTVRSSQSFRFLFPGVSQSLLGFMFRQSRANKYQLIATCTDMYKKERAAEEEDQAPEQIIFESENIRIMSNQSVCNSSFFITSASPLTMATMV